MKKDDLFKKKLFNSGHFVFDKRVSDVFDDMVSRSVPFYKDFQNHIVSFISHYAKVGTTIYDLGCSTGETIYHLLRSNQDFFSKFDIVGIDMSQDMLSHAKSKMSSIKNNVTWERHDLSQLCSFKPTSVCVLNLVLQFLNKDCRSNLLHSIYQALVPGGVVIIVEKIIQSDQTVQSFYKGTYHSYKKKQGYSHEEIANKDLALDTVLQPLTYDQNRQLLLSAGFKSVHIFFQWYNFVGFIAVKDYEKT